MDSRTENFGTLHLISRNIVVVVSEGAVVEDGALRKLLCMGVTAISERQGLTLQHPPEPIYTTDMSCPLSLS